MDKNWNEQYQETPQQHDPYQLPVSILLITSVVLLVFVIAIALLSFYTVFFLLAVALGTFIGLLLCSYFDLGFDFEDIRSDITKCLIVAAVTVIPIYLLSLIRFESFPLRTFVIIPVLFYWFAMKLSWLKMTIPETFLIAVCALSTTGLGAYLIIILILLFGGT